MDKQIVTPYEAIGGAEKVDQLVNAFYNRVAKHPVLIPLFPDNFTEIKRKQKQFLTQFLGGPSLYNQEHGHPMLRARHLRFPISEREAEAWLQCMNQALDESHIPEPWREAIFNKLTLTAHHMINTDETNS